MNKTAEETTRKEALDIAVNVFTHTQFKNLLVGNSGTINDVPFYSLVEEIYAFLNLGHFPVLKAFRETQANASN